MRARGQSWTHFKAACVRRRPALGGRWRRSVARRARPRRKLDRPARSRRGEVVEQRAPNRAHGRQAARSVGGGLLFGLRPPAKPSLTGALAPGQPMSPMAKGGARDNDKHSGYKAA